MAVTQQHGNVRIPMFCEGWNISCSPGQLPTLKLNSEECRLHKLHNKKVGKFATQGKIQTERSVKLPVH
jgi:hypothetical protein